MEAAGISAAGARVSDALRLTALVAAMVAAKAWLTWAAGFDLHYEEAQYWLWSQHLDWSYYSKGPLVAWMIAASTALFGQGEWQVRLPAWLCNGAFVVLGYYFARDLWQDRRAGWWTAALLLTTPLYFTLGSAMTTDAPLFVFWTWGLWAAYRALVRERPRAWYELGAAVGLGALAKLSIGLLPACIGVAVLLVPRWRRHLRAPQLWLGVLIMLAAMSPLLLWNAAHHWVNFRHELGHVRNSGWSALRVLRFCAGQVLALSPVVAVVATLTLYRQPRDAGRRLLWDVSVVCIAFFIFKAAGAKVELNWPAPAYIGLFILLGGEALRLGARQRRWLLGGMAVSVLILGLAYFPMVLGLAGKRDPFHEAKLWQAAIVRAGEEPAAAQASFILAPNYKFASELAFYWPRRLPVYLAEATARRYNQFDLWPGPNREAGRTGLYIAPWPQLPVSVARAFDRCTALKPQPAVAADGSVLRTFYPQLCSDYHVTHWPKPTSY